MSVGQFNKFYWEMLILNTSAMSEADQNKHIDWKVG